VIINVRRTSAALALAVLLTGCSAVDDIVDPEPEPWSLTGLPNDEDLQREIVVVKVENTPAGRPQLGIGGADLVVQELVEGGLTRLAAMFQSEYPATVGPVRSARVTDIGVVLPTNGTLVASGAAGSTTAAIEAAGVDFVTEGQGAGFSRDPARRAPYNTMLDVAALADTLEATPMEGTLLPFGEIPEDAVGAAAAALDLRWPAAQSAFAYDAGSGLWTRTDLADASDFAFTNVVALTVETTTGSGTDASGSAVPRMITEGQGPAVIATEGRSYQATWSKATPSSPWLLSYTPPGAAEPQTFPLPPGRTWLALIPAQGGQVGITPAPEPEPAG
jgi:hypothetical protein